MLCFVLYSVSFTAHAATNNSSDITVSEVSSNEVSVMSANDVASTIDNINYRVYAVNATSLSSVSLLLDKTVQAGSWGIQNSVDIATYRWSDYLIDEFFSYTKGANNLIAS